jgi:type II secretory pathway pseudopilin PulG
MKPKEKAFTILEVVIAMAILMLLLIGVLPVLMMGSKYEKINAAREMAVYRAENLLNYLSSFSFSNACLTSGTHPCKSDPGTCCQDFAGSDNLTYIVTDIDADTKQIEVISKFTVGDYEGNVTVRRLKGNW